MAGGMSLAIATYQFKQAFHERAVALFATAKPEFEVIRGLVGAGYPDQYMQVLGTTTRHEAATMSSNRTREETIELETQWFVFRYGAVGVDREAEDYLYARLSELERYIRVDDITLGGVVRECHLTEIATDTAAVERAGTGQGRLHAAIVTWEAKVRISNQQ